VTAEETLTAAQRRAILALLAGADHAAAAASARKSVRTLRRWLKMDAFRTELERSSRAVMADAILTLQRGALRAASALVAMSGGELPPSASRVSAARAVLELARDQGELDELKDLVVALAEKIKKPMVGRYQ
jgi:hypothetical protein